MPNRRYLTGSEVGGGEPVSQHGLRAWWQNRSWKVDLAVLARVRDGLRRLDTGDDSDGSPAALPAVTLPATGTERGDAPCPAPHALAAGPPASPGSPPPGPAGDGALADSAIASIRHTFGIVAAAGDEAASFFYGRLFAAQPRLRNLFPPAMDVQRDRLLRALMHIVEGLGSPEELVRYLSQLGRDHRKYSVEPAMYDAVGEALIATLRAFAREAFTPDAQEAWVQAYAAASALMIRAAEDDSALAPANWTAEVVDHELRQPGIAVLTVAPYQPLPYMAGQHVTVQTSRWPRVWRAYSVANRPRDDGLMTFHVRAVPGGWVSNTLVHHTEPGDEITLGPALGTMTLEPAGRRDLLCVAGGTGLSPIKAIIEQAVRESASCPRQIFVFYGARTREELYDLPDLYRLADAYPRLLLTPVTSDDPAFDGMQGNVARVAARYLPHRDCEAYVAGPVRMVREAIRVLTRAGVPEERVHYDDALLSEEKRPRSRPAPGMPASPPAAAESMAPAAAPPGETPPDPGTAVGANGEQANMAPASQEPASGVPASGVPADGESADDTPANGIQASREPANGTQANAEPADGVPANGAPSGRQPVSAGTSRTP